MHDKYYCRCPTMYRTNTTPAILLCTGKILLQVSYYVQDLYFWRCPLCSRQILLQVSYCVQDKYYSRCLPIYRTNTIVKTNTAAGVLLCTGQKAASKPTQKCCLLERIHATTLSVSSVVLTFYIKCAEFNKQMQCNFTLHKAKLRSISLQWLKGTVA
jgi:hypothetical protein